MDKTRQFTIGQNTPADMKEIMDAVYASLVEKGYDPIMQIVGYILSEDPTYITNHKGARSLITRVDRDALLRELVRTEDKQTVIGERLSIKVRTVQANVTSIYRKTGVSTRSGLGKLYHDAGEP